MEVRRALAEASDVEGLSDSTVRWWRTTYELFRRFLARTKGERGFLSGDVRQQVAILNAWLADMRARGVNHTSINTNWRGLHALVARLARASGSIDPTVLMARPRPGRPIPRFLTRQALEQVFAFVRNFQWEGGEFVRIRNLSIVAVMALGGLRRGEVLALDASDIDLDESSIRLRKTKGDQGGRYRVVYMPPALRAVLARFLELRKDRQAACPRLFLARHADRGIAPITIRRVCDTITRLAGIKVAPHMLRHTCATLMRQSGVPDRLSMDQLGHSSLTILQRYSHVEHGELRRAVERVDVDIAV